MLMPKRAMLFQVCNLMDSARAYLLESSPPTTTLPGIERFQTQSTSQQGTASASEQVCVVLVALESIDASECPALLFGSHTWPQEGVPRNLDKLGTLATSFERGDCIALDLKAAWKVRDSELDADDDWRAKTAVLVFGGDDVGAGEQVWFDELRGRRGSTPTTVVQWSKGVPPPDEQHYT